MSSSQLHLSVPKKYYFRISMSVYACRLELVLKLFGPEFMQLQSSTRKAVTLLYCCHSWGQDGSPTLHHVV
jgi:hypothetical protein